MKHSFNQLHKFNLNSICLLNLIEFEVKFINQLLILNKMLGTI